MPLVDAKCTNCGAPLKVDNTVDAAICEHCGSAYIVEKAINNFYVSNTNNIYANVVNLITDSKAKVIPSKSLGVNDCELLLRKAGTCRLLSVNDLKNIIDLISITKNKNLKQILSDYISNLNFKYDFDYASSGKCIGWFDLHSMWESAQKASGQKNTDWNDSYNFKEWFYAKTDLFKGSYEDLKTVQSKITDYYFRLLETGRLEADFKEGSFGITLWNVQATPKGIFKNIEVQLQNKFILPYFLKGLETAGNLFDDRSEYLFIYGHYCIKYDSEYHSYTASSFGNYNLEKIKEKTKNCAYIKSIDSKTVEKEMNELLHHIWNHKKTILEIAKINNEPLPATKPHNPNNKYIFCINTITISYIEYSVSEKTKGSIYSPYCSFNRSIKINNLEQTLVYLRRKAIRCQYCGGNFKGVLSKVCLQCGKSKNY